MNLNLQGKTVVVTGGTGIIGQALLTSFAAEGANVICAARNEQVAREIAERARSAGLPGRILAIKTDVTDRASVDAMVKRAREEVGPVDVLVNNVGTSASHGPFESMSEADCQFEIAINISSVDYCIQAVAPHMLGRGGSIVNISSGSAFRGGNGFTHYGAVKGYMVSLTRSLAKEWGPKGVRLNTVVPSLTIPRTEQDMSPSSWLVKYKSQMSTPEAINQAFEDGTHPVVQTQAIKRLGRPDDIANAVVFLASDAASFVTGQLLHVNGGNYMA